MKRITITLTGSQATAVVDLINERLHDLSDFTFSNEDEALNREEKSFLGCIKSKIYAELVK